MAATGGEPERLDRNHLWIHRGGPTGRAIWRLPEVATIIDTRAPRGAIVGWTLECTTRKFEPGLDRTMEHDHAGKEVRVRKKCRSFMLMVEGRHTHRPFWCLCATWTIPLGTAENRRVAPASEGAGSVNLRIHGARFLTDRVCVSARRGMVWGSRLP